MNWTELFKLYNLKKIGVGKLSTFLTMFIIFITSALSVAVPTISQNISNYNTKNIRVTNGGDLSVQAMYPSKAFDDELSKIKNEGFVVTYKDDVSGTLKNSKNIQLYSHIIVGEKNLKDNEIILSSSSAKNLSLKVNDKVFVKTRISSKWYTVKDIEGIPKGITNDERLTGYVKINGSVLNNSLIYITKNTDGETLKTRLKHIEPDYTYSSIKDQSKSIKTANAQTLSFGILTAIGYILSSAVVITTSIVTIIKRKKDIAIMKLLSIKNKTLKRTFRLELSIVVIFPTVLGAVFSILVSYLILKFNYIPNSLSFNASILLILKGIILNLIIFSIFLNLPLSIISKIKGLWILKESSEGTNFIKKRLFISSIFLIPAVMLLYSIYSEGTINFITSIVVLFILLVFLMLIHIIIKILSKLPLKQTILMYSLNNINKNIFTFSLTAVSLSLTIVIILTAFSMSKSIESNISKSFSNILPYNYFVASQSKDLNKILTKQNGVYGYIKEYSSNAKVLNSNVKNKGVQVDEIKKNDYKISLKIVEGSNLFAGKDGCLITYKYQNQNNLKIGDTLHLLINNKVVDTKIKGIYDNSIINSTGIALPYKGYGKSFSYYVKASEDTKLIGELSNIPVVHIGDLASGFSDYINDILKNFKFLSVLVIAASIIFNVNLISLTFIEERKEETIIRAIGIGKNFISKTYFIKYVLLTFISTIIAFFFYKLILKSTSAIIGANSYSSNSSLLLTLISSVVLCFLTLIYPYLCMKKYKSYEFLRED